MKGTRDGKKDKWIDEDKGRAREEEKASGGGEGDRHYRILQKQA